MSIDSNTRAFKTNQCTSMSFTSSAIQLLAPSTERKHLTYIDVDLDRGLSKVGLVS